MEDWGEIELINITEGHDFWCLLCELSNDESGFLCNKISIVEAYKDGNLYGLQVVETQLMYERRERENPIFCTDSFYLLPCFCIKERDEAVIIWTHTRARRRGFARKLVEELNIKTAYHPLPGSEHFWNACHIEPAVKK